MLKLTVVGVIIALVTNLFCVVADLNYIASVALVMGSVVFYMLTRQWKLLRREDTMLILGFITFSNIITVVIEKLMIFFDVWGFSNATHRLIGISFLGAPIEEYVYWWLAPVVVSVTYYAMVKLKSGSNLVTYPSWTEASVASLLAKFTTEVVDNLKTKDPDVYLETNNTKVNEDNTSSYSRGKKAPVWIWVAVFVIIFGAVLYRFFRGSWKAVLATTLIFLCIAYPNELYSLHSGFWVYNQNRMLGPWVLGVPIEEWIMYTASPITGCMLLSVSHRLFFKRDL